MDNSFRYRSFPQEIIFGGGALEKISDLLTQYGWKRAMLVTSSSQRFNGNVARIQKLLSEKLVTVTDKTQQHVPQSNVDDAVKLAQQNNADVLIALGGGSALGVAKATAHTLRSPVSRPPSAAPAVISGTVPHLLSLPILAIPTTYAGSEMTPFFGVTREHDGVMKKETVTDVQSVPRVVLYDPLLTLDVPPDLTASTGINALAHCVETVYSITRNPLSTVMALEGARLIFNALPRCYENGNDTGARGEMLQGAYLAGAALANVAMGLHHGVCHVLGGTANVPHGIANAIVLPHAMRFNVDACPTELAQIAAAMGVSHGESYTMASEAAQRVEDLVRRMNLPLRLRDAGVSEQDIPKLAVLAFQNRNVQNNPKRIQTVDVMEKFLREMY